MAVIIGGMTIKVQDFVRTSRMAVDAVEGFSRSLTYQGAKEIKGHLCGGRG